MKFREVNTEIGMRFYKFISDDEYVIKIVIKNYEHSCLFMDEETFKTETITEEELDKDYTLLSNYRKMIFIKLESHFIDLLINDIMYDVNFYLSNYPKSSLKWFLSLNVYRYMSKSVFTNFIKYVSKNNDYLISLEKDDIENMWNSYFNAINIYTSNIKLFDFNRYDYKDINMDKVVEEKERISDAVFSDIEEQLNQYILTYQVYNFDDSVNTDNVNMKYFLIYQRDKYYIVLYVRDETKESNDKIEMYNKHLDIFKFML